MGAAFATIGSDGRNPAFLITADAVGKLMTQPYLIRPVEEADLPLLTFWRREQHVRRWWGPPDIEPEADSLRAGKVNMWIVLSGELPLAFIQDYAVADWSPHHFDYLPPGSRGMDLYIGVAEALGQGHGAKMIQQHVERFFRLGVPAIGIDPHPDNERARRSFARAGFITAGAALETRWGRAILMHCFA